MALLRLIPIWRWLGGESILFEHASAGPDNAHRVDDVQLLEQWMAQYGRDVINTAYAYVHNFHQAEDIAQDVFLRAYSKRESFRGDSSVRTWLLSITINRCKDYLRSWSFRHELQEETILDREVAQADTEATVVEKLARDDLWQSIHQLPEKYREVIALYYIQELNGQEIALVLQTSEQNVRTRLHRARAMLKDILTERGETSGAREL